jgi:Toastrack DUF4097
MKRPRIAPVAAIAVLTALGIPDLAFSSPKETERVEKTVTMAPGGTLTLKNFSGKVTITGESRGDVHIVALRTAEKDRLANIKLDVQSDGRDVTIDANKRGEGWTEKKNNNVVETVFEIRMPDRANLDVDVFSSPVQITGVTGSHHVHGFSSDLRLDRINGPIEAETFSGGIYLAPASWQQNQSVKAKTFSGDIEMRVPQAAAARVQFDSFSGDVKSDIPLTLKSKSKRKMEAEFNTADATVAAGDLSFKTFSGDVRIVK